MTMSQNPNPLGLRSTAAQAQPPMTRSTAANASTSSSRRNQTNTRTTRMESRRTTMAASDTIAASASHVGGAAAAAAEEKGRSVRGRSSTNTRVYGTSSTSNTSSSAAVQSLSSSSTSSSSSSSIPATEFFLSGSDNLVSVHTIPLCYTNETGHPYLIRMHRITNTPRRSGGRSGANGSAAASAASSAASSSLAANAARAASQPTTTTYIRASDACMVFLTNASNVSGFIKDFSVPFEKVLLRIAQQSRSESYCFTLKGMRRLAWTRRVQQMKHYKKWIEQTLIPIMRTEEGEKIEVPIESRWTEERRKMAANATQATNTGRPSRVAANSSTTTSMLVAPPPQSATASHPSALHWPDPSRSELSSWCAASMRLCQSLMRIEADKAAQRAAAEPARAAAAAAAAAGRSRSSAGTDWAGDAAADRFANRYTRIGARYQAEIPDMLTPEERAADNDRDDDELIYAPFYPRLFIAPLVPWPRVSSTDPLSRRAIRLGWEQDEAEKKRSTRGGAAGTAAQDNEKENVPSSLYTAALALDKQLASMQKADRIRLLDRLELSAWNKANRTPIKRDRGRNDFEIAFLSLFIKPGALQEIFTHTLPDPSLHAEAFDVCAIECFVPMQAVMALRQEQIVREARTKQQAAAAIATASTPATPTSPATSMPPPAPIHRPNVKRKRQDSGAPSNASQPTPTAPSPSPSPSPAVSPLASTSAPSTPASPVPVGSQPISDSYRQTLPRPLPPVGLNGSNATSLSDPRNNALFSVRLPPTPAIAPVPTLPHSRRTSDHAIKEERKSMSDEMNGDGDEEEEEENGESPLRPPREVSNDLFKVHLPAAINTSSDDDGIQKKQRRQPSPITQLVS